MEIIIAISLVAIVFESYYILRELRHTADLLQRISLGLFPIPNGGLDKLVYLQLIHDQLVEITKSKIGDNP